MCKKSLLMMLLMALLAPWAAKAQTTVTIGEGTSTQRTNPIGTYYNYSITEQLYTADEIGMAGTISSISFNYAVSTAKDFPITVYMANVDAENLTEGISLADADEVFSGTLSVSSPGWATITLDAPFAYDGRSNLLIGVIKDYLYYYNDYTWYVTTTDAVMARYTQSDSNGPYTTSTVPGSTMTSRPNIQIVITAGGGGTVCEKPTTVTAFDITPNSAWLSWEGGSTPGAGYNVELKGGNYADWTRIYSNVSQGCILTNLTPGTSYSARVQVNCSDTEASGWKSVNFLTPFAIPLVEGFGTSIPTGWSMYTGLLSDVLSGGDLSTTTYGWVFGSNNGVFDNHARVNIYGTSCKYWLVTPSLVMEDNVQLMFDLAYTAYSGTGAPAQTGTDDKFAVLINNGNGWTVLRQWDNAGSEYVLNDLNTTPITVAFDLSSYAGQNIAVAFYGESTTSNADNNLHIDNVSINYIPDCAIPTSLAKANVTAHTVDLSWTSEASAWVVAYKTSEDPDFREVNVTENPYTLTGLTPETAYTVKVKANCDGVYSEWTAPVNFTTAIACTVPTGLATSNLTGHSVTLTWTAVEGAVYESAVVKTAEYNANNIEWGRPFEGNTVTLSDLDPETGYTFALRKDCTDAEDGYSQIVTRAFTTTVACPAPTVAVSNVTTTTAEVSCTNTDAENFNVMLGEEVIAENITMPYRLTDLTANTSYTVKVKALCGGEDGESEWSNGTSFMTAEECPDGMVCIGSGTATNNYIPANNFYKYSLTEQIYTAAEIGMAGQISSIEFYKPNTTAMTVNLDIYMVNTEKDEFTSTTDWIQVTANDLVYSGNVTFTNNDWTNIELQIPFNYDGRSNLCIVVDNNTGSYESSTPFRAFTATKNQTLYQYSDSDNLDPTAASVGTASGSKTSYKNRIRIAIGEPPACAKPSHLAVNYEGGITAEVTWEGEATSYNIDVNGTVTEGVTSPYTLEGLELATNYAVKVQANCGGDLSEWATTSFTTDACMPEDMTVINYELEDSYGDGWNDNYILVVDGDCNLVETLTITSGNSASGTLKVCGQYVSFMWYNGNYANETSWTFTDAAGNELFSGSGTSSMQDYDVLYVYDHELVKRPSDLVVHEDAIGPYGAKLSWTENGTATAWQIGVYDETETLINTVDANSNPFMLTGLQAETTYSVKVRSVTSAGQSAWTCPGVGFTTGVACGAPSALDITPNPISANVDWIAFEEGYDIEWTEVSAAKDGGLWLQYDNGTFATSIGSTTSGVRTWGVMYPAAMLEGNKNLTKVAVYEDATYYTCESYTINIYQGINQPETLVGTETVVSSGETGMHEITLTAPITLDLTQNMWITMTVEGTYVMMACQSTERNSQWWDNNADGVWTNMVDDNSNLAGYGWMIRGYVEGYDPADFNWISETGILPPYTIEDLSPETTYFVKVKASCGTEWIWAQFTTPSACDAPIDLTAEDITYNAATLNWVGYQDSYNVQYREATKYVTVWEDDFENGISDEWTIVAGEGATHPDAGIWYTINPIGGLSFEAHGGDYCASSWSWNNSAYQADNWLITPQLDLQGVLKYYVRTNASYPDSYEVLLSTTDAETTSFTVTLKEMAAAPGNGEWNEVIIDLSAYNGQTGYIAIHHVDYDMNYLCIDDFGIYSVVEATAWIPATTTEPTLALTGLTHDTDYEWQVQGINAGCDGGLTEWSEIAIFTAGPLPTQTIALNEGWNWVSFYVEITLNDLKAALVAAVPGTAITIQGKNQGVTYNPNNNRWVGRLNSLDLAQMYSVKVTSDCEIAMQGFPIDPAEHPATVLGSGQYTYIAFPLSESMTLTEAFAGFAVNGDKIQSKNATALYNRGRWQGTSFTNLVPGQGYTYKSSASAGARTLVFPTGNRKTVAPSMVQPQSKLNVNPTMVKMPRTIDMFPTKK